MADLSESLSSLPSRPLSLDEIDDLEDNDRILAMHYDDEMVETTDQHAFAYNCVLITADTVTAAVYIDKDETWYRVYHEPRDAAELTDAYDAIRDARDDEDLFLRGPITIEEVIFRTDRPSGEDTSGYSEGDDFDCPVCGDTHTVKLHEDEYGADLEDIEDLDRSYLYVECPHTRRNELFIEFQAKTGGES